MNMRGRFSIVVAQMLAIAGCGDAMDELQRRVLEKLEQTVKGATDASVSPPVVTELTPAEQLGLKLNLYVDCTNGSRDQIYDSYARYREFVRPDGVAKRSDYADIHAVPETALAACVKAMEEGPIMPPPLPELERALALYNVASDAYARLSLEIDRYFEREDYKDDQWGKLSILHPKLVATFTAWQTADDTLANAFEPRKAEADRAALADIETRLGRNLEYEARRYVLEAKAFIGCVDRDNPTIGACETPFRGLEQAHQDFNMRYSSDKQASDRVFWMSSYAVSTENFFAEAKKFVRELREGKVRIEYTNRVIDEYNDLVRDSNNLRFEQPQG